MGRRYMAASAVLVAFGVLGVCRSASAHHGSSAYADQVTVLKDATVTTFQWANPHTIVMFDVKDDAGRSVHWPAEAGSPSALSLIGWSKSAIQPGDTITVYVFRAKSGSPVGRLNKIVMADGTEYRDSQLGNGPRGGSGQGSAQ
jgi:hypothetical protein